MLAGIGTGAGAVEPELLEIDEWELDDERDREVRLLFEFDCELLFELDELELELLFESDEPELDVD